MGLITGTRSTRRTIGIDPERRHERRRLLRGWRRRDDAHSSANPNPRPQSRTIQIAFMRSLHLKLAVVMAAFASGGCATLLGVEAGPVVGLGSNEGAGATAIAHAGA